MAQRTPAERFWAKVDKGDGAGCWLWTAAANNHGYGVIRIAGRSIYTHRFAYELLVGSIPAGLELDHLCRRPPCCNPAHMEPVTHRENSLRGTSPMARQARQTHCFQGHDLTGENVYRRPGRPSKRECRRCAKQREARRVR